jgi:hypothetical protein
VSHKGNQKQDQKNEEQDLRYARECNGDTSEANSARDESDDQKH